MEKEKVTGFVIIPTDVYFLKVSLRTAKKKVIKKVTLLMELFIQNILEHTKTM